MLMMMIISVTQSIFKLGPPDCVWKQIQIIPNDDKDDNDEDYSSNYINFQLQILHGSLSRQYIQMMVINMMKKTMMIMIPTDDDNDDDYNDDDNDEKPKWL